MQPSVESDDTAAAMAEQGGAAGGESEHRLASWLDHMAVLAHAVRLAAAQHNGHMEGGGAHAPAYALPRRHNGTPSLYTGAVEPVVLRPWSTLLAGYAAPNGSNATGWLDWASNGTADDMGDDYDTGGQHTSSHTFQVYLSVSTWLACILAVCCMLGVLSNCMSIWIFTRPSMKAPVNVLLTALSAVDATLLVLAVPAFVMPGFNAQLRSTELDYLTKYATLYLYPVTLATQTCSVWLMVLITIERYFAVCRPFEAASRQSATRMACYAAAIGLASFAYNLVRFWEYSAHPTDPIAVEFNLRENHYYYVVYYTSLYLVTHFAVPFSLLIILNMFVVRAIVRARWQRRSLTRHERGEHNTSFMMIVVTAMFAVCNALTLVINVVEMVDTDVFMTNPALAFILNDVSNLLVVINSSTTWIIYYRLSTKYRRHFKYAILRCCAPRYAEAELLKKNRFGSVSSAASVYHHKKRGCRSHQAAYSVNGGGGRANRAGRLSHSLHCRQCTEQLNACVGRQGHKRTLAVCSASAAGATLICNEAVAARADGHCDDCAGDGHSPPPSAKTQLTSLSAPHAAANGAAVCAETACTQLGTPRGGHTAVCEATSVSPLLMRTEATDATAAVTLDPPPADAGRTPWHGANVCGSRHVRGQCAAHCQPAGNKPTKYRLNKAATLPADVTDL